MDFSVMMSQLGSGMLISVEIFALTLIFSLPLGLFLSFGRMSTNIAVRNMSKVYISVMRGTPLMLQLLVVYFGPYYIFNISIKPSYRFIAVIIGFVLNYAAYFAEIYRAGIESIPVGQMEAGQVLGMTRWQTYRRIIIPQVIKRILPPMSNEFMTLVKDTALAQTIGVMEMFTTAKAIAASQKNMTAFIAAGIFYYVFNLLVAMVMEHIEKKMNYYH